MATATTQTYKISVLPVSAGSRSETSLSIPAGGWANGDVASDPSPPAVARDGFVVTADLDTNGVLLDTNLQALMDFINEMHQGTDVSSVVSAIDAL